MFTPNISQSETQQNNAMDEKRGNKSEIVLIDINSSDTGTTARTNVHLLHCCETKIDIRLLRFTLYFIVNASILAVSIWQVISADNLATREIFLVTMSSVLSVFVKSRQNNNSSTKPKLESGSEYQIAKDAEKKA